MGDGGDDVVAGGVAPGVVDGFEVVDVDHDGGQGLAGAAGFVGKRSAPDELADAIRRVAAGGLHVNAATGQKLALDLLRPRVRVGAQAAVLSDREVDVLRMLGAGMSEGRIW